jgi:hypothetical protein
MPQASIGQKRRGEDRPLIAPPRHTKPNTITVEQRHPVEEGKGLDDLPLRREAAR